jgi:endonuclease/exonuclease/phosphatase family metal-dependent hydrolase
MATKRPAGRRIRESDARRPLNRAGRRRRAARRRSLAHLLVAGSLVGLVVVAGLVVITPKVISGSPSLQTPVAPRVSETAGTMLRVSWRPVLFSDYYEVTILRGAKKEHLKVEGTEVQVPNLSSQTDYAISVRAVNKPKGEDVVRSKQSSATLTRTEATDRPELLVPSNATVAKAGNTYLDVAWDPVETSTGYEVQLSPHESFAKARSIRSDGRTATFKGLDAAKRFFVRVRAEGKDKTRSAWSQPLKTETIQPDDPQPLSVASYNIKCHSCGGPSWLSRRGAIAATIASHGLDVVGLQEAQQSDPNGVGTSQFTDLMRQLASRQDGWKITDSRIDGTLGTRVIYNTRSLRLVKAGATHYGRQLSGNRYRQRYYSWAVLTQRSSGKNFLFVSTHLEPRSTAVAIAQARQLSADTLRLRGDLPSVVVGDFNASQYHAYSVHQAMTSAGYVDPLGVLPSSHQVSKEATVEHRINTHLDSFNNFGSTPKASVGEPLNGTYIDYIFSTPMRVLEFENVVDLDSSGHFRGGAPSDHDMLRAVVGLP